MCGAIKVFRFWVWEERGLGFLGPFLKVLLIEELYVEGDPSVHVEGDPKQKCTERPGSRELYGGLAQGAISLREKNKWEGEKPYKSGVHFIAHPSFAFD